MVTSIPLDKASGLEVHDQGADGDGLPVGYVQSGRFHGLTARPYCDGSCRGSRCAKQVAWALPGKTITFSLSCDTGDFIFIYLMPLL